MGGAKVNHWFGNDKRCLLVLLLVFSGAMIFAQAVLDNSPQPPDSNTQAGETNNLPDNKTVTESTVETGRADTPPVNPEPDTVQKNAPIYSSPVEAEPSFKLSGTEGSIVFSQRLSWEKAQYAVRYEVILERKRDYLDTYVEVLRKNVSEENDYLDISVPAGSYRFKVLSYNILDQPDTETAWEEFTIIQALQPSVVSFTPEIFYLDRQTPRILTLVGENLVPDADIYLVNESVFDQSGKNAVLRPSEIYRNELGENARLIFAEEDLVVGKYQIIVRNPGGLDTVVGGFTIAIAKPYDINVSGGYAPMLTFFGQRDYFLDSFFVPVSFSARASFVPFKLDFGFIGVELCPSWTFLTTEKNGIKTSAHLVVVNVDGLFQYWIKRREIAVNGRAGFGFAGVFNYYFQFDTGKSWEPISTAAFSFNLGSSVMWFFYKQFFVEGGLDYIQIVHPEIPMGFVRIGIFGGYQF